MHLPPFALKRSLAWLGLALLTSPFALVQSATAQSRDTPYCFAAKDRLSVFSRPSPGAATADYFNPNDIVYATTNPPTTVFSGGRAFVEVAIYGGNRGWLPRLSTIDGVPLIVDLTTDQCTNPPLGAAGYRTGSGGFVGQAYCFVVGTPVPLYSRPSFNALTGDRYAIGDIAYATRNPPATFFDRGVPFVEVAIYGGNRAWAPRYVGDADVPALVDLSADQCTNPGPGAAGY